MKNLRNNNFLSRVHVRPSLKKEDLSSSLQFSNGFREHGYSTPFYILKQILSRMLKNEGYGKFYIGLLNKSVIGKEKGGHIYFGGDIPAFMVEDANRLIQTVPHEDLRKDLVRYVHGKPNRALCGINRWKSVNADILCLEELPKGVKHIEEEPSREDILFSQEAVTRNRFDKA